MKSLILGILISACAAAQDAPRFPAPLGLDRRLIGVVSDCVIQISTRGYKTSQRDPRCTKDATFLLKTGDAVFQLRGNEKELKKWIGKKATVIGTAIGDLMTVRSVEAPDQ